MRYPHPVRAVAAAGFAVTLVIGAAACGGDDSGGGSGDKQVVGLITKTDTNPFFVKMKEGAQQAATAANLDLQSFAGKQDGDNEAQVQAIESLISNGAKGILITPSDSKAIRHLRHRQLPGGPAHRAVGQGEVRQGRQAGQDRLPRPQRQRRLRRRAA
jgi:hypothetical protein